MQPRPAAKTLHTTGVVSPTSLANLATPKRGETDRNTDQTDQTPAAKKEPDHTEEPMQDLNSVVSQRFSEENALDWRDLRL